jgi:hypothetical protein
MNPKVREAFRRQKQIRIRLARASFRLEMAELERIWAIVSAHREGLSVRDIARQVGLGPPVCISLLPVRRRIPWNTLYSGKWDGQRQRTAAPQLRSRLRIASSRKPLRRLLC